jgi:hypothetical protein
MLRQIGGVVSGVVAWFFIANVGEHVLRVTWPGYSEVEVAKTFTLGMLMARLLLGAICSLWRWLCRRMGDQPERVCDQVPCWLAAYHVPPRDHVVGTLSTLVSRCLSRLSRRCHAAWWIALSPPQEAAHHEYLSRRINYDGLPLIRIFD